MNESTASNLLNFLTAHTTDKKNGSDILSEWSRYECPDINFQDIPIYLMIIENVKESRYPKTLIQKCIPYTGGNR